MINTWTFTEKVEILQLMRSCQKKKKEKKVETISIYFIN